MSIGKIELRENKKEYVKYANMGGKGGGGTEDISDAPITFEQATELANVQSGDSVSVALGKLSKLYASLENVILNSDLQKNAILVTNESGKICSSDITKDLLKNLKIVAFDAGMTKTTILQNAQIGITPIHTYSDTPYEELPSGAPEWKYASGMLLKRSNEFGTIILYGYQTNAIAITSTSDSGATWTEWDNDNERFNKLELALNPSNFDFKLKKYVDTTCSSHIEVLKNHWNEAFEGVPAAGGYRIILTNYGSANVVWTCYAYQNKLYGYALCFSHPNNDVSSPQYYTISNGTWTKNELVRKSDVTGLIQRHTANDYPRNLKTGSTNIFTTNIIIPSGYKFLTVVSSTIDNDRVDVFNMSQNLLSDGSVQVKTSCKNTSGSDATNFTIIIVYLIVKSEFY